MRLELEKVEMSVPKLEAEKLKLLDMNPSADLTAVYEEFTALVVDEVIRCKNIA